MATLYVAEQGAVLTKTDGRLLVRSGRKILRDIPAIRVDQIVLFGNVHLTTPAVAFVLNEGIDVAFLSSHGSYRGRLQPEWTKDAKLRQRQYSVFLDPRRRLVLARQLVHGKLHNMASLCRRQRSDKTTGIVKATVQYLARLDKKVTCATDLASLRGWEGAATAAFYQAFSTLLRPKLGFQGRNRRPPRDPVNALLSLGYTLLYNTFYATINVVGFDPYLGFFHEAKRGHAALASDLMEEWRPLIVDSLVLSMINHRELGPEQFLGLKEQIRLTKNGLEHFLARYDARLASRIRHPRLERRMSYRRCIELQTRHLADVLRNPERTYHPFLTQ
jgi:CRISPR-associated protein Cas1